MEHLPKIFKCFTEGPDHLEVLVASRNEFYDADSETPP